MLLSKIACYCKQPLTKIDGTYNMALAELQFSLKRYKNNNNTH